MGSRATVVVLSTADFDSELWTNKQYIADGLAEHYNVIYMNSMGLRRPSFSTSDLKRALKSVKRRLKVRKVEKKPERDFRAKHRLAVVDPASIPLHGSKISERANRRLLGAQFEKILADAPGVKILWAFSPVTYGIESQFDQVIYHCVDLLQELQGVNHSFYTKYERNIVRKADRCLTSSSPIQAYLKGLGATEPFLWENVADTAMFSEAKMERSDSAIFAGNMTPNKVDFELLSRVADGGTNLVLAGPVAIDGSNAAKSFKTLIEKANVTYLGSLSIDKLAVEVNKCKVGLIPYKIDPHTTGIFPLKLYEYLSAGLTVVSTPLPALVEKNIAGLRVAHDADVPAAIVQEVGRFAEDAADERRLNAQKHSWEGRRQQARELIQELVDTWQPGFAVADDVPMDEDFEIEVESR